MTKPTVPSPNEISASEFQAYLTRYPACIKTISELEGPKDLRSGPLMHTAEKPKPMTLLELDEYRYGDCLKAFGLDDPKLMDNIQDLIMLMEWKLRYGKYRPTLMKLLLENQNKAVETSVREGIAMYKIQPESIDQVMGAIKVISSLRGIGPATASLILSVHDPDRVIFFSDEGFYWLCGGGKKASIQYNKKEYQELLDRARKVAKRLGVRCVDVEKVAFVAMRESLEATDGDTEGVQEAAGRRAVGKTAPGNRAAEEKTVNKKGNGKKAPATNKSGPKRKVATPEIDDDEKPEVRRSKRGKRAG